MYDFRSYDLATLSILERSIAEESLIWFGYAYRSQVLAVPLSRYFLRSKDLKVRETSRALTHIRNPMVPLEGLEPTLTSS